MTIAAVVLDCETTGLSREDRIVSLALVELDGALLPIKPLRQWVFNPGRPSHPRAREVHGFDDAFLAAQPTFATHAHDIRTMVDAAPLVVAHNIDFDFAFLDREFVAAGFPSFSPRAYCTMRAVSSRWPTGRKSLDAALARFDLARAGKRHEAGEDALLAAELFRRLRIEEGFETAKRAAPAGQRILRRSVVPTAGDGHVTWRARSAPRAVTPISKPVVAELPDEAPPPAPAKISWVPAAAILATLVGGVWLFAGVAATPADPAPAHAAMAVRPPVSAPQMAALPPVVNPPTSEGGRRVLTREEIAVLQTTLNLVGFDVGSADGVVGPRTRAALREIERQAGWSQYAEPRAAHLQWAQSRLGRAGRGR